MKDNGVKSDSIKKRELNVVTSIKPKVNLSENVLQAKKMHTRFTIVSFICLFIGFFFPVFLIVTVGISLHMFSNKNAKQRMYVSNAANNLLALKLDKAKFYLKKAKSTFDNELVQMLEKDINNVENMN